MINQEEIFDEQDPDKKPGKFSGKKKFFVYFFVLVFLFILVINRDSSKNQDPGSTENLPPVSVEDSPSQARDANVGTYITPRNFPFSVLEGQTDSLDEYFGLSRQVGDHVAVLQDWSGTDNNQGLDAWQELKTRADKNGLKFHFHFSPLTPSTREATVPPPSVEGTSFSDESVRQAFIDKAVEYASYEPDVLGIGVEVNLLLIHDNPEEYKNYVRAAKEEYQAIKEKYPSQTVTISFSWDIMKKQKNFEILSDFKDSLDIYSFTTYPNNLTAPRPDMLPDDFFSSIRTYLPGESVAISELGWFSAEKGSEQLQAEFFGRLPELLQGVNPEFVTHFLMFDLSPDFVDNERFNSLGLIRLDGISKKSWSVFTNLNFR